MTQDTAHLAVVDDRQSQPRDLSDMASSAGYIAIDIKWAGKRLGYAFEHDNAIERIVGMAELQQAYTDLAALIAELEAIDPQPMTDK